MKNGSNVTFLLKDIAKLKLALRAPWKSCRPQILMQGALSLYLPQYFPVFSRLAVHFHTVLLKQATGACCTVLCAAILLPWSELRHVSKESQKRSGFLAWICYSRSLITACASLPTNESDEWQSDPFDSQHSLTPARSGFRANTQSTTHKYRCCTDAQRDRPFPWKVLLLWVYSSWISCLEWPVPMYFKL